ncbi:MAG TPA: 2OG-Fe(II) oxygenase [Kofleriaceae bacterium]|nr:2OG-Fe(II) oxygenase [Kofleriaceae bacterium]
MCSLDTSRWDLAALARSWQRAAPFPHLVIDDLFSPEDAQAITDDLGEEPCALVHDQIFEIYASTPSVLEGHALVSFRDELGTGPVRAALHAITGIEVSRLDMRAFAYHRGHYLLPHTDRDADDDTGRALAYTYYAPTPAPVTGGQLELFDCELRDGEIISTSPAVLIEPRPNRLVLFEVGPHSLHQVREVEHGIRLSLAGWFFR